MSLSPMSGILFLKMGSPTEPGNLVSQGYANFQKTVWMKIVHLPRFRIIHWELCLTFKVFIIRGVVVIYRLTKLGIMFNMYVHHIIGE